MRAAFAVLGPPVAKERPRVTSRGTFTPAKTRAAEKALKAIAFACLPEGWPLDAAYQLSLRIYFGDRRRRDMDNVAKLFQDAFNGVVWKDDSQVAELHCYRGYDKDCPRVEVDVSLQQLPQQQAVQQ